MTEQEKRDKLEKVIKGLGSCVEYFACKVKGVMFDEWLEESRKAIALLKAQEPRVMTLEELSEKTDVWFESLVYGTIDPALSNGSYDDGTIGLMTLEDELFYMDEADYGINWRCWTSRPTEEQREATPWTQSGGKVI